MSRFSVKVMDFSLEGKVAKGMYIAVRDHVKKLGKSFAQYQRELIMKDLKIDEFGNTTEK